MFDYEQSLIFPRDSTCERAFPARRRSNSASRLHAGGDFRSGSRSSLAVLSLRKKRYLGVCLVAVLNSPVNFSVACRVCITLVN